MGNCSYDDCWREVVENPDGSLKKDKIVEILQDYSRLQHNASVVYQEITNNLLSKSSYPPDTVLPVYHDLQEERNKERHQEIYGDLSTMLKNMLGNIYDGGLDDTLKEYFGILEQV